MRNNKNLGKEKYHILKYTFLKKRTFILFICVLVLINIARYN
jgi:hypothetical protein